MKKPAIVFKISKSALIDQINTIFVSKQDLTCIRFCLSHLQTHNRTPQNMQLIINLLMKRLHGINGYLYSLPEGDLFLLIGVEPAHNMLVTLVDDITTLVEDDPLVKDEAQVYELYNLPNDHLKLLEHFQKIEADAQAKLNSLKITESSTSKVTVELNTELFNSNQSKRKGRKVPLILIVEDDPFSLKLIISLIREHKCTIISAVTAEEAIKLYAKHAPDITFLDNGLPDATGQSVLRCINQHDKQSFVVMLTGDADASNIKLAINNGVKDYIAKPFSQKKMHDCLARYWKHWSKGA